MTRLLNRIYLFLLFIMPLHAQSFIDSADHHVDISEFLRTKYGFVVVPSLVTEPAIGYGGGLGIIFIHRDPLKVKKGEDEPPSFSGAGGFYTENHSWAVGGGHFGVWKKGHIRYRGGIGYAGLNLKYYRQPLLPGGKDMFEFNLSAYGITQEIVFRIAESHFYGGVNYTFAKTNIDFNNHILPSQIAERELELSIGGMGLVFMFDNRDNIFTPNYGMFAGIRYIYNAPWLGSDQSFHRLFSYWLLYHKVFKNVYGGLRLDLQRSFEDTPFYLRPFISLRGIPAMRYQGETTYLAEIELRWDVKPRWSLVGFGGYGQALPASADKLTAYNYGLGFRYLIARLFGIRMGADIARGPEDWAFYIQFGSSWFRY
jgi:hypothetical protein